MDIKGTAKTITAAVPAVPACLPPVPPAGPHRGGATLRFEKIETSAQFRDQKMDIKGTAKTATVAVPASPPPVLVLPAGAHRGGAATLRFEKIETCAQFRDQKMDIIGMG